MTAQDVIKKPFTYLQAAPGRPAPAGRRRPRTAQGFLPVFAAMEKLPSPSAAASRRIRAAGRPRRGPEYLPDGAACCGADTVLPIICDELITARTSAKTASGIMNAEDVLKWIEGNLPQIKGHARKYLAYSPYELEEFVQQAYETALGVRKDNRLKAVPFERIFWSSFRVDCLGMTYTHGKLKDVFHDEYQEFGDDESPATEMPAEFLIDGEEIFESIDGQPEESDIVDDLSPEGRKIAVRRALDLMTFKERRAWEFRLVGYTCRETARLMGISRQNVQNFLKRGLMRAKDLSSPVELRLAASCSKRAKLISSPPAQHYLPLIRESCLDLTSISSGNVF